MESIDTFRYIVGAYFGIREMDNYDLKEYVLKDIEDYIRNYVKENYVDGFDYREEAEKVDSELSLKTKLQDALIVLPRVNASMELILLVKAKLKAIREEELNNM